MHNWKVAEPRRRRQQVPSADAAVLIGLLLVAVRPRLRALVWLFWAELRVDRCETNLTTPRCGAATCLVGMSRASIFLAATFLAVQAALVTPQHQGSKSRHRISDSVPSYLHSPQRRRWLPGRRDMLRESSWRPCVKIIPEYQDNSIYCDAEWPPVQPGIVLNCGSRRYVGGLSLVHPQNCGGQIAVDAVRFVPTGRHVLATGASLVVTHIVFREFCKNTEPSKVGVVWVGKLQRNTSASSAPPRLYAG